MIHEDSAHHGVRRIEQSVTILRTPMELYDYWRHVSRVPTFMKNVVSVEEHGARSHWVAQVGSGIVSWDLELTDNVTGRLLAWKAVGQVEGSHFCEVWFSRALQGRGTVMRVILSWNPTPSTHVAGLEFIIGEDPEQQLTDDLRRFKQLVEAGAITTGSDTAAPAPTDERHARWAPPTDAHPTFALARGQ
jgi:uncharacterized membrane protein